MKYRNSVGRNLLVIDQYEVVPLDQKRNVLHRDLLKNIDLGVEGYFSMEAKNCQIRGKHRTKTLGDMSHKSGFWIENPKKVGLRWALIGKSVLHIYHYSVNEIFSPDIRLLGIFGKKFKKIRT